jgi:hypothetical protein
MITIRPVDIELLGLIGPISGEKVDKCARLTRYSLHQSNNVELGLLCASAEVSVRRNHFLSQKRE